MKINTLCIHTTNQAEKLAALLYLSKLSGLEISETVLAGAINNDDISCDFCYVGACSDKNIIDARIDNSLFKKTFKFSEIKDIKYWLSIPEKPEAPVIRMSQKFGFEGETYIVAKVGGKLGLVNINTGNVWDSDLWVLDKNNPTLEDVVGEDWSYFKKIA